jgi:hypothetical protein
MSLHSWRRRAAVPLILRLALLLTTAAMTTAGCSSESPHWRGETPRCVTRHCPSGHASLSSWHRLSIATDDQTVTVYIPAACGQRAGDLFVELAEAPDAIVIGVGGGLRASSTCAASRPVSFRLRGPLRGRTVYDAKTGDERQPSS